MQSFNYFAVIITVSTILISVYFKKITSKIPGSFVAIIITTIVVSYFNLPITTIETFFGNIPNKFDFIIPTIHLSDISFYIAPALTIALLGGIESLLSAVVSDGMIGANHRSNTELIAQGIANIVTPFFGGIPATGAIARTATNVKNGGRTPIAGIFHAITLLIIMLFVGKWAKLIPMASLAGVLIVVAYNMSEWRSFKSILKGSVFDIIVLLTTFFLTVLVNLTIAIEVGVVLSALLFMRRMAGINDSNIMKTIDSDLIEDYSKIPKGISIYEISGPLFFASAKKYSETIIEVGIKSKILIIRMRHVPFVDSTGVKNLIETIKILHSSGILIVLSGVNETVLKDLGKNKVFSFVDRSNIFNSFDFALEYSKNKLEELYSEELE
jgi:SulP family sulfate permease